MKSLQSFLLLILASSSAFGADTANQCYSARSKIFADGKSLGYYYASASVTKNADSNLVSFSVSMPDSGQILAAALLESKSAGPGKYTFQFVDGWDNKGKGSLVISGKRATLTLEEEEVAPGGKNVLRNYGTHKLALSACK